MAATETIPPTDSPDANRYGFSRRGNHRRQEIPREDETHVPEPEIQEMAFLRQGDLDQDQMDETEATYGNVEAAFKYGTREYDPRNIKDFLEHIFLHYQEEFELFKTVRSSEEIIDTLFPGSGTDASGVLLATLDPRIHVYAFDRSPAMMGVGEQYIIWNEIQEIAGLVKRTGLNLKDWMGGILRTFDRLNRVFPRSSGERLIATGQEEVVANINSRIHRKRGDVRNPVEDIFGEGKRFHHIFAISVLQHLRKGDLTSTDGELFQAVSNLVRVVKPGGTLYMNFKWDIEPMEKYDNESGNRISTGRVFADNTLGNGEARLRYSNTFSKSEFETFLKTLETAFPDLHVEEKWSSEQFVLNKPGYLNVKIRKAA